MADEQASKAVQQPVLVSACLLGLPTRYDGESKRSTKVLEYLEKKGYLPIPVCPEQLAGMTTPRDKTFFQEGDGFAVLDGIGKAVSINGEKMNDIFYRGAKLTLHIANLCNCSLALLKERSPSCGVHQVYLEGEIVDGSGVTAAMLIREGFQVISEEDI